MIEVMPRVAGEVRESTTWSIVLSVLLMMSGVLAISIPPVVGLAVTITFGWLLIVTGALHLAYAWRGNGVAVVVGEIVLAVVYALAGLYTLAHPVAGLAAHAIAEESLAIGAAIAGETR
jgi:uncharacterized membrane protein HdeD (DUF308 family)